MGKPLVIYLDMDGVCTNFVEAVFDLFERTYTQTAFQAGEYSLEKILNLSPEQLWTSVNAEGADFWRDLEPYLWFDNLYSKLTEIGNVYFCSSPTRSSTCLLGKIQWLQDRFGKGFRNYIFTPYKHLLAKPGTLLIDDSDAEVEKFFEEDRRAGTILFPQPWNSRHKETANSVLDTVRKAKFFSLAWREKNA